MGMPLLKRIGEWIKELGDLVFVPRCGACNTAVASREIAMCEKCTLRYLTESKKFCKVCARPHRACVCKVDSPRGKVPIVHVTGYDIRRSSVSRSLILNLKNDAFSAPLDLLAEDMLMALRERYIRLFEREGVVITYLPRSKRAKRRAGHDQSEQLARRISALSGAPLVPLFVNNSKRSQKKLNREQRIENAKNGYALLADGLRLDNKVVIMVDDIVTTGASMGACAALVKSVGAKAVIGLVCAKAVSYKGLTEIDII
jgi:ComF family protein